MLKKNFYILLAVFLLSGSFIANNFSSYHTVKCKVCFTPGNNCTQRIIDEIKKAKKEILIQTYSFTSMPIVQALIEMKEKGIEVIIIADYSQINSLILLKLKQLGIKIYIDHISGIAHNKVIIIDKKTVLTGSFNFTKAAQYRNAENSIILYSEDLAKEYNDNFEKRLTVSKKLN